MVLAEARVLGGDDAAHQGGRDMADGDPAAVEAAPLEHPLDHQEGHRRRHEPIDGHDGDRARDAEHREDDKRPAQQPADEAVAAWRSVGASNQVDASLP